MGHNELLLSDALRGRNRDDTVISVKFGALRDPDGGWAGYDGRPAAVKNFAAYSLRRLGIDHIDIYRPSRLDPQVPIEDTVGAIAELVQAGHVRHIGLSEVGADTLRRAQTVHPIADLQIEYSLLSRGIETGILPAARELGIAITAYGVAVSGPDLRALEHPPTAIGHDFRGFSPRFQRDNLARNLTLVDTLRTVAQAKTPPSPRSRSPGSPPRATTSCPWSAPAAVTA
jgi:aryl-alcohol dehydrogenase-like predicted oxidoreductase